MTNLEKQLAAEQAAGDGEAVSNTTTGESNGRHDGLRPAVHGRVVLGGCAPGALADLLFASDDVMSLNAKLGLTMDQLVPLAQAVLSAISIHPAPAAPVQQVVEREEKPIGHLLCGDIYGNELQDWEFEADPNACDQLNELYFSRGLTVKVPVYARAALAARGEKKE